MFSQRSTAINRLRAYEWKDSFARHGFEIHAWHERRYPLPPNFERTRLDRRWQGLSDEELEIGQLTVAVSAPGRGD